jgi:AcrR family transcriptional regulator
MNGSAEKRTRTKAALYDALIGLCEQKSYQKVRVLEIAQAAGVDKSTFYRYYSTKDELLRDIEDYYFEEIKALNPSMTVLLSKIDSDDTEALRSSLIKVLEFHMRYRKFTIFLLSPSGDPAFRHKLESTLMDTAQEALQMRGIAPSKFREYGSYFLIQGYYNTLWRWLKEQDCPLEEFADYLMTYLTRVWFTN